MTAPLAPRTRLLLGLRLTAALLSGALHLLPAQAGEPTALPTQVVTTASAARGVSYDGVVEAVRQTVLAAQVSGAVAALPVKAGDHVKAGQLLVRLDARAAEQQAGAAAAQVQAARASQDAATREFDRQRQLFEQRFISQAALDRAEAQHKSAQAQAAAQLAAANAASTQTGFYAVRAPYDGVVSDVSVVLGDMAMPGRPLVTVHDPAALRVSAAIPESAARTLSAALSPTLSGTVQVELPGVPGPIQPMRMQTLPAADALTHTVTLRVDLPAGTAALPGAFARVAIASAPAGKAASTATAQPTVPSRAVVRRAELTGIYVLAADGKPLLRQVRLGAVNGDQVEVLTGLTVGERVVTDPQAAGRVR